jgi:hypothetical protein
LDKKCLNLNCDKVLISIKNYYRHNNWAFKLFFKKLYKNYLRKAKFWLFLFMHSKIVHPSWFHGWC